MKKFCLLIISLLILFSCQSCKFANESTTYEDGIDISIAEELVEHMIYKDQLPVLHFDMKNVNVSTSSTKASVVFVNNDFYQLSDAWAAHLAEYKADQIIVISASEQTNDKGDAKFGGDYLDLDEYDENGEPQKYSIEYRIACWDNTGTRYSYQYRSFVSGGKRYYVYCYTTSLTITMEQSLIVVQVDGKNKLLLAPLPYDTKYEVSGSSLTVKSLIEKDTYLSSRYRKYLYPESLAHLSLDEQKASVKKWYQDYCHGEDINGEFIIKYAGAKFKVNFDAMRQDNNTGKDTNAFELIYLGAA